jgi:hypothetical protein
MRERDLGATLFMKIVGYSKTSSNLFQKTRFSEVEVIALSLSSWIQRQKSRFFLRQLQASRNPKP